MKSFPLTEPLFQQALTHASYRLEESTVEEDNERLEFLGDAVLQLCVTELLFSQYPAASEGDLTRMRHLLVDTGTLADIGRDLSLGEHIRMGRGEENDGGRNRDRMLANVVEALLGALYQTQGLSACQAWVEETFTARAVRVKDHVPPKQQLMEWCQKQYHQTPSYREVKREGLAHERRFTMGVWIQDELIATGVGSSKKDATIETARNALQTLGLTVPKPI